MAGPKWQRGVLVTLPDSTAAPTWLGAVFWTEGPPNTKRTLHPESGAQLRTEPRLRTNVRHRHPLHGRKVRCAIEARCVELLPEFADEVPLVDYETWAAEQRRRHG